MKTIKSIISQSLVVALMITTVSCKSSKKNAKTNVVDEVKADEPVSKPAPAVVTFADPSQQKQHEETMVVPTAPEKEKETSYAFSASFFSTGEGTDGKMMQRFKDFIVSYGKENNVELIYDLNAWGREGEADFCFQLTELDLKGRNDFIEQSKKMLSASKLVHVIENGQCHPKRR